MGPVIRRRTRCVGEVSIGHAGDLALDLPGDSQVECISRYHTAVIRVDPTTIKNNRPGPT